MSLQYVFGNPTRKKRKKSMRKTTKRKVTRKAKSKKKNPRRTRVSAHAKKKVTTSTGRTYTAKGKKIQTRAGKIVATKADLAAMRTGVAKMKEALEKAKIYKSNAGSKAQKKKYQSRITKLRNKIKSFQGKIKKKQKARKDELKLIRELVSDIKSAGHIPVTKTTKKVKGKMAKKKKKSTRKRKTTKRKTKRKTSSRKKATRKKASRKKTTRRKKSTKRKTSAKKKTSSRKKTTRKKTRRKSTKKKSGMSMSVRKRKGKKKYSVTLRNPGGRKMKNPTKLAGMKVSGYENAELVELMIGGLGYGFANKYVSPWFSKFGLGQLTQVAGGTLPTIIVGALVNALSDTNVGKKAPKVMGTNLLEMVGDGLIGAGVVGAGVAFSQSALTAAFGGVDFIPASQKGMRDFGGINYTPEMHGVDYTPEMMGGVDFIPGPNLPGHNDHADFGEYEESAADFGVVPEGLQGMN